jgi:hypothetical protein
LVLSQYLPSQNMGKLKRFDTQLVGCQSFGNTFQKFLVRQHFSLSLVANQTPTFIALPKYLLP